MTNNIKAPMGLWSAPITVSIVWIICMIISVVKQSGRNKALTPHWSRRLNEVGGQLGKTVFKGLTIPFFTIFITIIFIINAQKRKFDQVEKEKPDEAEKAKQYNKRNKVRRIVLISVVSIIGWMLLGFFPFGHIFLKYKRITNDGIISAIKAGFNVLNPFALNPGGPASELLASRRARKVRIAMFFVAVVALAIGISFSIAWMSQSDPLDDESDGTAVPSGTSTSAPFGSEEIDDAAKFFKGGDYAGVWTVSIFLVIYFIFIIGLPGLNTEREDVTAHMRSQVDGPDAAADAAAEEAAQLDATEEAARLDAAARSMQGLARQRSRDRAAAKAAEAKRAAAKAAEAKRAAAKAAEAKWQAKRDAMLAQEKEQTRLAAQNQRRWVDKKWAGRGEVNRVDDYLTGKADNFYTIFTGTPAEMKIQKNNTTNQRVKLSPRRQIVGETADALAGNFG